ncbi:helix-turn-helix domain-containing protein [Candidimonas humi]|uniref:Transcriptional regulator n=1 Tax=Candidimonas humi TaxID=683355 RepID=A0ABV8NXU5_9BURK|nr:YdaS family helix-turn-helix protein [Candidimonas humi]MBV6304905.1 helix-turn-helix domain-containing protein [Candidimonas humi]
MNAIASFLAASGLTQSEFGRQVGLNQSMVYQLIKGLRPVPEKVCVRIERATAGAVTRRDLRPDDWADIWPELKEADHA